MAETNHSKDKSKSSGKEMGLGLIFLLLLVGVFIIWVITGGPQGKQNVENRKIVEPVFPSSNKIPSFGVTKNN